MNLEHQKEVSENPEMQIQNIANKIITDQMRPTKSTSKPMPLKSWASLKMAQMKNKVLCSSIENRKSKSNWICKNCSSWVSMFSGSLWHSLKRLEVWKARPKILGPWKLQTIIRNFNTVLMSVKICWKPFLWKVWIAHVREHLRPNWKKEKR